MTELAGKVVLVTGASRGIGEAAAVALGREGAVVMLTARDGAQAMKVARRIVGDGGKAAGSACDVADYGAVERLVRETRERFGAIDVLVNNAGVVEPIAMVAKADPAAWARNVQINLAGAFNAVRAVIPAMLAAGKGTIINLSSGAAHRPLEGWSAYCAAKAGLAMLTRAIALETEGKGIRVFGFAPGTKDTDMKVTIRSSGINLISRIPRGDLTPVAHPARAIVYLCKAEADDLAGQEFALGDAAFRQRIGLA